MRMHHVHGKIQVYAFAPLVSHRRVFSSLQAMLSIQQQKLEFTVSTLVLEFPQAQAVQKLPLTSQFKEGAV